MAKVIGGPFGLLSGKLGNRIYYIVDGEQRSRAVGKITKPPTKKQLANRLRMKTAFAFAKAVGVFIDMGFGPEAEERNIQPRNAAVGYIRKHSLTGEYSDIEVDYPKVVLSIGDLPGLNEVSTEIEQERMLEGSGGKGFSGAGLSLRFRWTVGPADRDWPRCNDQVMLMAYCPEMLDANERACFKLTGVRRIAGEDVLVLPEGFQGKALEVYISAISDDRKSVSDSQYLGQLLLSDSIKSI